MRAVPGIQPRTSPLADYLPVRLVSSVVKDRWLDHCSRALAGLVGEANVVNMKLSTATSRAQGEE